MKKTYFAPDASLQRLTTADVITLSQWNVLGPNDWSGVDVSASEWKPVE